MVLHYDQIKEIILTWEIDHPLFGLNTDQIPEIIEDELF